MVWNNIGTLGGVSNLEEDEGTDNEAEEEGKNGKEDIGMGMRILK